MSDDEVMCLFVLGIGGLFSLVVWYRGVLGVGSFGRWRPRRQPLALVPLGCLALLWLVLSVYADDEVRHHLGYKLLFTGSWAVAIWFIGLVGTMIGVEPIAQGLERLNRSAIWAGCGMWLGSTLAMAGSNIGEGPTIYTTLGPSFLAITALASLWIVFDALTGNAHVVAVDRDPSAGIRLGALLSAWGLILGRAVAGDWESAESTLSDFTAAAWPTLALLGVAAVIEPALKPTPRHPERETVTAGLLPAVLVLTAAFVWLAWIGGWDGQPWSRTLAGPV